MTKVLLSVGSNQNNPQLQIQTAFDELSKACNNVKLSSLYLTQPVSEIAQDSFINAAITLETNTVAPEFLKALLALEHKAGRIRSKELLNGPRSLDLDIILFGDELWSEQELNIPHPRYKKRRFVLEPAAEIAANMLDPITHKTIAQLLVECQDENWVRPLPEAVVV